MATLSSLITVLALGLSAVPASKEPVRGFYLHACWDYAHPFAVRKWTAADYQGVFRLLRRMGYNTVMLWPVTEAIPAPLSQADAAECEPPAGRRASDRIHGGHLRVTHTMKWK